MAKPVIAKNDTAYWVDARDASSGWVVSQAVCGAFNKQPEVGLKGGDVVCVSDRDRFRSLREERQDGIRQACQREHDGLSGGRRALRTRVMVCRHGCNCTAWSESGR